MARVHADIRIRVLLDKIYEKFAPHPYGMMWMAIPQELRERLVRAVRLGETWEALSVGDRLHVLKWFDPAGEMSTFTDGRTWLSDSWGRHFWVSAPAMARRAIDACTVVEPNLISELRNEIEIGKNRVVGAGLGRRRRIEKRVAHDVKKLMERL